MVAEGAAGLRKLPGGGWCRADHLGQSHPSCSVPSARLRPPASTPQRAVGSPAPSKDIYDGDEPVDCAKVDVSGKQVRVRLRRIEAREADNSCRYANLYPQASGAAAKD